MPTLIQIWSISHSGSTMLDLMLGNSHDSFSCGEVHAWYRPWRQHHFAIDCSCGQNPCLVWEDIKGVSEDYFHLEVFHKLGVNYVIDSSKDPCWLLDSQKWANRNGIEVSSILLWKEPLSLAYSYWKRDMDPLSWRNAFVYYYGRALNLNIPFIVVGYEDIVKKPQSVLAKICILVNMKYFVGKEHFWTKQHHYLFGASGTRKQAKTRKSSIKTLDSFPPEFQKLIPTLSERINQDSAVSQLVCKLRNSDFSRYHTQFLENNRGNYHPPKLYPFWYYKKKLLRKCQRWFPRQFDPNTK